MHTSFSHHRLSRTSGFPCTTNITAYAGSARDVTPNPPVATRLSCDLPSGRTALPSRWLDAPRAPASLGFAVRVLLRPSCTPGNDRCIRDWASRPRDHPDAPKAVSVHRDPVRASDDGHTPLSDWNDSTYTLVDICVK